MEYLWSRYKKDMESIIWQQQQTICKLNEENQLFKSKLKLTENQLLELTKNKQESNVNERKLRSTHLHSIPSVTSTSDNDQFVIKFKCKFEYDKLDSHGQCNSIHT